MSSIKLGTVKSPKGTSYEVKWDPDSHDLYVGGNHIGKAKDAREAMHKAEAWAVTRH
jgi:hypothetical protein